MQLNTEQDMVERTTKSIANKDENSQRMETFETNMLINNKELVCLSTVQDEYGISLYNNPISDKKLISKFESPGRADKNLVEEENEEED